MLPIRPRQIAHRPAILHALLTVKEKTAFTLSHKSDPRGEIALRRGRTSATLVDLTLVLWTPGPIRSHREEFLPEGLRAYGPLCIQTHCFLLGDNSSITTLYLNPFITSSYYKNTIR